MESIQSLRMWTAIHQIYQVVMEKSKELLKAHDIGDIEYLILFHVAAQSEFPQAKLNKILHFSKASVSLALRTLEAKKYIRIKTDAKDQRHKSITLTRPGERLIRELFTERGKVISSSFGVYSEKEQADLIGLLGRFHGDSPHYKEVTEELELLMPFYFSNET